MCAVSVNVVCVSFDMTCGIEDLFFCFLTKDKRNYQMISTVLFQSFNQIPFELIYGIIEQVGKLLER
jgi:hypothetical protein